jgi:zinc and cadmium transporter
LNSILSALIAVIVISLISIAGIFFLSFKEKFLDNILYYLVSFSSGAILGAAFFDLIPESAELINLERMLLFVATGFVFFYLMERSIYWFHGHGHLSDKRGLEISSSDKRAGIKSYVYLNVLGDAVHNLIDGMVIGASFIVSLPAGVVTTLAVVFHELPQEIGDFAILIYGGLDKVKALIMNFTVSLTAIFGVFITYLVFSTSNYIGILLGFAGGGFIYLSATELIPELRQEKTIYKSMRQFVIFILGMLLVYGIVTYFH